MKIIGLHYGDIHPVHEAWFQEVGELKRLDIDAEPGVQNILRYAYNARKIPDCDVILCEEGTAVRSAIVKKFFNPRIKIIRLIADQGFYKAEEKIYGGLEERFTHKFVDGGIAVSDFARKYALKYIDGPIEVVNPFVPDLEKYLNMERERLEGKRVLFIGENNPNKNIGALVEAIKDEDDLTLDIVGRGHREYSHENIHTHGYVDSLDSFLERADLYVQPSDGDTFPVATLEAMASSLPVIVTSSVGTKTIVSEIDKNLVCNPNSESIQEAIEYYYSLNNQKKLRLAGEMRSRVKILDRATQVEKFEELVNKMCGDNEKGKS